MRYLSLVFASLLLVGCSQGEVGTSVEDVDIRSQQGTEQSEVQTEDDSSDDESYEDDSGEDDSYEDESSEDEEEFEEEESEEREEDSDDSDEREEESERYEDEVDDSDENESDENESIEDESDEVVEEPSEEVAEEPAGYTFADVQANDSASSCWSVINGNVYDLTGWINSHPGGSSRILNLCGTDGSSSFNAMHGGQSNPESRLQSFLLGPLS